MSEGTGVMPAFPCNHATMLLQPVTTAPGSHLTPSNHRKSTRLSPDMIAGDHTHQSENKSSDCVLPSKHMVEESVNSVLCCSLIDMFLEEKKMYLITQRNQSESNELSI